MRWENEGQVGSNSYKYIFMAAQASLQPVITSSSVVTHPHEDIEYHPHDIIIIVAMILMIDDDIGCAASARRRGCSSLHSGSHLHR